MKAQEDAQRELNMIIAAMFQKAELMKTNSDWFDSLEYWKLKDSINKGIINLVSILG